MKFDLCEIFERCLKASYIHVENDGSYATYKINDTRYILFQHSNGKGDWKNNFDFPSKAYKGMDVPWKCHRGFLKVWKSVMPYVEAALEKSEYSSAVIVGYSHGAALSALCFEYVWYNYPEKRDALYGFSFGCPRIFFGNKNHTFLEERFAKFVNIINSGDIVTKIPPAFLGYKHLGKLIHIGNSRNVLSVNAHKPDSYMNSLKSIRCVLDV